MEIDFDKYDSFISNREYEDFSKYEYDIIETM